jgi:hypothetical protein
MVGDWLDRARIPQSREISRGENLDASGAPGKAIQLGNSSRGLECKRGRGSWLGEHWRSWFVSVRGVPFDFAQGRLSTAFGIRLTSLRMTG